MLTELFKLKATHITSLKYATYRSTAQTAATFCRPSIEKPCHLFCINSKEVLAFLDENLKYFPTLAWMTEQIYSLSLMQIL